jgi:hypothetical protein
MLRASHERSRTLAIVLIAGAWACDGGNPSPESPAAPITLTLTPTPVPACPQAPAPTLVVEPAVALDAFRLVVTNASGFHDSLFVPSPDLPPCGSNTQSSRTWVEIRDARGPYLYGYCALQSAGELATGMYLPFALTPRDATAVRIVLTDRRCSSVWSSIAAPLPGR